MRSGENKLLLFYTQSFTRIRDRKKRTEVLKEVFSGISREVRNLTLDEMSQILTLGEMLCLRKFLTGKKCVI